MFSFKKLRVQFARQTSADVTITNGKKFGILAGKERFG